MDQPKTETILRMLVLLSGDTRYTVSELSMHFTCSKRTIYRDLATVEAELSLKAANLLREEYPLAEKYLSDLDVTGTLRYLLKIPVADYHGIGRFVLGLQGEVNVIGPKEFKIFLREAQKKMGVMTETVSG